jgi:peroxiredoxin
MTTTTRNMAYWPAIMLLFIGVFGNSGFNGIAAQSDGRGYKVQVGDPIPDFSLTDLDGKTWSKESLMGSVYILQFTASWCGVCRKEMPHLEQRVWQAFKDDGVVLLGVDLDEPAPKVAGLVEDTGVTYPVCLDPGGALFAKVTLPKAGVTRNVVVNRDGRIAFLTRLFEEAEFESMVQAIENLTHQGK